MKPLFILPYQAGAIKLSQAQAEALFTPAQIAAGEARGKLESFGPWQLPLSYTALCTSNVWANDQHGPLHVFGVRTLSRPRQEGHALEGRVSIGGRKYRAFTSSQLFELPDGRLINAEIIHACGAAEKEAQ